MFLHSCFPNILLPAAMGIALLPVAAFLSPEETHSKMNLPKGVLRLERVVKQLLEEEEAVTVTDHFYNVLIQVNRVTV